MKRNYLRFVILSLSLFLGCKSQSVDTQKLDIVQSEDMQYTIAFGSCNKQYEENKLWQPILGHNPDLWIWGGDNIYSDTYDMAKMKADYDDQWQNAGYRKLMASTRILGTWDDHDYGLNDGGEEYAKKDDSQQLFLDFLGVAKNDQRRQRKGIYHSETINIPDGQIKVIILDTRYFRTALTEDKTSKKRYQPNVYGQGTILGETQWQWLETELSNSKADFNLIVSSIQFLSYEHGFETWGNFPHEVDRLKQLIVTAKANGVLLLSGDRHISEFSKVTLKDLDYPLIDFTSSGLTHAYTKFSGEPNAYRVGSVVAQESFGLLHFNFRTRTIIMEMRGENNEILNQLIQTY